MGIWNQRTNMTMLTDYYELTMSQAYFDQGMHDKVAVFDLYFRNVPDDGGYAMMAGVEQMIEYLENLHFEEEDIAFLRSTGQFSEPFLDYLANFTFECDVWAIPEGTPLFPSEPIVKVKGPIVQAQMIETMLLLTINHQSLIATKSSRIVRAAEGRPIMEFGARRAQGYDASVLGARAAYIGGAAGTSCTICGQQFNIPLSGTMAHSFIQAHSDEYAAFVAYAVTFPDSCVLLVDTYDTIDQGIPNAIRCAKEVLEPMGKRLRGIRIDSGDLAYLTKQARVLLDEAGLTDCKITVSNSLDEYVIRDLIQQGAKIDAFGVGERLITSKSQPVFGGVYKLSAIGNGSDELHPRMKVSDNQEKITNPGDKKVYRFYDRETGMALADLIALSDEVINDREPLEIFHPIHTWKRKVLENFTARELLVPIFEKGQCVYTSPDIEEIRSYAEAQLDTLWPEMKRLEYPQTYYVDLSQELWDLKNTLLHQHRRS